MKTYKIEEETKFVNGVETGKLYYILYWCKPWYRKGFWTHLMEDRIDYYAPFCRITLEEAKKEVARLTEVVTYETKEL